MVGSFLRYLLNQFTKCPLHAENTLKAASIPGLHLSHIGSCMKYNTKNLMLFSHDQKLLFMKELVRNIISSLHKINHLVSVLIKSISNDKTYYSRIYYPSFALWFSSVGCCKMLVAA